MNRKLKICENCMHFYDRKNLFVYCTLQVHELPKSRKAFELLDVHERCSMIAEYCMEEWNDEKKA